MGGRGEVFPRWGPPAQRGAIDPVSSGPHLTSSGYCGPYGPSIQCFVECFPYISLFLFFLCFFLIFGVSHCGGGQIPENLGNLGNPPPDSGFPPKELKELKELN